MKERISIRDCDSAKWRRVSLRFMVLLAIGLLCATGCQPMVETDDAASDQQAELAPAVPDPLTVMVVDAPEMARTMARSWSAQTGGKLKIVDLSLQKFLAPDSDAESIQADVALYPAGVLADLVSGQRLLPIPDSVWKSDDVQRRDLLTHYRQTLVKYDSEVWAMPLGGPQWSIVCNNDLLTKVGVDVPKTWDQWHAAVAAIQAADLEIKPPDRVIVPLAEGWAAHSFLARCAATIRHQGKLSSVFDRSTMVPLIDREPFVAALTELQAEFAKESDAQLDLTPAEAFKRAATGQSVMALTWPMELEIEEGVEEEPLGQLSVSAMPGSPKWFDTLANEWVQRKPGDPTTVAYIGFDGMQGSVSSDSRNTSTAFDFLQWLASKPVSSKVLPGGLHSGPFRSSHLKSPYRWTGQQLAPTAAEDYADLIRQTHRGNLTLIFPRLPGYADYLASLDQGVRKCLVGKTSPQAGLSAVAAQWEKITDRLGRKAQIANLRKTSGL